MSIITEALDRLQTERARRVRHPDASTTPESSDASDSPAATVLSLHPAASVPQRSVWRSVSLVLLGSVGIGAYLWVLPVVPGDAGPSEHKTAAAKELNPARRPQVVGSIPGQQPVVKTKGQARDVPQPSSRHSAPSQPARPKVSEQSTRRLAQTNPKPLAAAKQPSRRTVNAPLSRQQNKNVSRPRNATPGDIKLARARQPDSNAAICAGRDHLAPSVCDSSQDLGTLVLVGNGPIGIRAVGGGSELLGRRAGSGRHGPAIVGATRAGQSTTGPIRRSIGRPPASRVIGAQAS